MYRHIALDQFQLQLVQEDRHPKGLQGNQKNYAQVVALTKFRQGCSI